MRPTSVGHRWKLYNYLSKFKYLNLSYLARGAEGRHEQHRGLRKKALMRDLGTRLKCRHGVFVRTVVITGKTLWK